MHRQLDASRIVDTLQHLGNRISERFPNSGLAGVARDLHQAAGETRQRIQWISRPHYPTRILVGLFILLMAVLIGLTGNMIAGDLQGRELSGLRLVEFADSATNELLLAGAAILFLVSIETRIKRTRAQHVLHELRVFAHVIDMHQLTKDASRVIGSSGTRTASSPQQSMTLFELTRYLDYCSELLSLTGKLAALYAQSLPDSVVVSAVNDIETLTSGLSRKIWQKIIQLDRAFGPDSSPADSESKPTLLSRQPPSDRSDTDSDPHSSHEPPQSDRQNP